MPWPEDQDPIIEVQVVAKWKEAVSSHEETIPTSVWEFWLPAADLQDFDQVEAAAFAYIRDHLEPVVAALPKPRG